MRKKVMDKDDNISQRVYKYQSINQYSLMNLLMEKVWFSSPLRFNDPYEARFAHEKRPFFKNAEEIAHNLAILESEDTEKENMVQTLEFFFEIEKQERVKLMEKTTISCFTQSPDNLIMWAHYGDSHKGMCIEFDTHHRVFEHLMEVEYSDNYPGLLEHVFADEKKQVFIHKGSAWAYEHEYRVIKLNSKERAYSCKGAIRAIYFGCNTQKSDIDFIVGEMSKKIKTIRFYKFKLSDEKYELVPLMINNNTRK